MSRTVHLISLVDLPRTAVPGSPGAFQADVTAGLRELAGSLILFELRPGAGLFGPRSSVERVLCVREGSVELLPGADGGLLRPGDAAYLPAGTGTQLRNTSPGMVQLLVAIAGHWTPPATNPQVVRRLENCLSCPVGPPLGGTKQSDVASTSLIVDSDSDCLSLSTLECRASKSTDGHAHPDADEFHLLLDGSGTYRTPNARIDFCQGQLAVVTAGERHVFSAGRRRRTLGLLGHLRRGTYLN